MGIQKINRGGARQGGTGCFGPAGEYGRNGRRICSDETMWTYYIVNKRQTQRQKTPSEGREQISARTTATDKHTHRKGVSLNTQATAIAWHEALTNTKYIHIHTYTQHPAHRIATRHQRKGEIRVLQLRLDRFQFFQSPPSVFEKRGAFRARYDN